MSTNGASDTDFAAKCPQLTKGCWPAWWYHTTLRLQEEGVLGLVKGDCTQSTTQGRDHCECVRLAERACFILRMRLGSLADDRVKDIDYNDPQRIYRT